MNYRNYMTSMMMDSNVVLIDGKVLKNRFGEEEFTAEQTIEILKNLDEYVIQYFDRKEGILKLTSN
jgi:hypothetical protein